MRAALDQMSKDHSKALSELEKTGVVSPFVQHTLNIIKRSQVRDPLYQPIVSVQPLSRPVGGLAFYKPKYGQKMSKPAGTNLLFRVVSISALQRLLSEAAVEGSGAAPRKYLLGLAPDGQTVALFHGPDFRVLNGLDTVQSGLYEVEGLRSNDGYETFLLGLCWRSAHGWPTELHAIAVSAIDDISAVEQTT